MWAARASSLNACQRSELNLTGECIKMIVFVGEDRDEMRWWSECIYHYNAADTDENDEERKTTLFEIHKL